MSGTLPNRALTRRRLLSYAALALCPGVTPSWAASSLDAAARFAQVTPGRELRFPEDERSHPDFRIEWWYVTGWIADADGNPMGFQITFFRNRVALDSTNPSAFTPRQIIVAHAALSEPSYGKLRHDQRISREVLDLAGASGDQMNVWIDGWRLRRGTRDYRAHIPAQDFVIDFRLAPTQPPMLQGDQGFSRKGPGDKSASYYYSLPQLRVSGTLTVGASTARVGGIAWFDHEWSSSYLDKDAVGWDWVGVNLADRGAFMAFRMRDKQGGKYWAGGAYRSPEGKMRAFNESQISFEPTRFWRSPRTGTRYPVSWIIRAGEMEVEIRPLMDDQENDARLSTGTIYWEGAVEALRNGRFVGRGYLELTGYWRRMSV